MDHPFVEAMFRRRLYAFASDYIRLEALLGNGGLYLDTDVELLKDPRDLLEFEGLTLGLLSLQNRLAKCSLATNWVAAGPKNPVLGKIRNRYDSLLRAVMNNTLFTQTILPQFSGKDIPPGGGFEFLEEKGIRIYHPDFFNPIQQKDEGKTVPQVKPRSIALHYGTGAWFGKQDPAPILRRLRDLRLDRKIIRPIEQRLKDVWRIKNIPPTATCSGSVSIPKIIHYVWLGGRPLSPLGQNCLKSWQQHLPGWEIRRWDETNSPVDHPFVKKMLAEKKYAFASDYIRLFALAKEGGLYLDTDMELIGDICPLLKRPCVLAFLSAQNRPSKNSAAMGFFACQPRHPWVLELKGRYEDLRKAIMNNTLVTQNLLGRGLADLRDDHPSRDFWDLGEIRIYHSDFFYPTGNRATGFQATFRTLGIHHAEASWHGQASPLSWWVKILDYRFDRRVLRPIENAVKKIRR